MYLWKSVTTGLVVAVIGAATLANGGVASAASTITACVAKNGAMSFSSNGTCPNGQTPLTWNVQGPQGVTGPAGPGALSVYDANNKVIGPFLGTTWTMLNLPTQSVIVTLGDDSFFENPLLLQFFHLSNDCSGPRYMMANTSPIASEVIYNNILYYPANPLQTLTFNSGETFQPGQDVTLPGTCNSTAGWAFKGGLVSTFDISVFGYAAPFTVR